MRYLVEQASGTIPYSSLEEIVKGVGERKIALTCIVKREEGEAEWIMSTVEQLLIDAGLSSRRVQPTASHQTVPEKKGGVPPTASHQAAPEEKEGCLEVITFTIGFACTPLAFLLNGSRSAGSLAALWLLGLGLVGFLCLICNLCSKEENRSSHKDSVGNFFSGLMVFMIGLMVLIPIGIIVGIFRQPDPSDAVEMRRVEMRRKEGIRREEHDLAPILEDHGVTAHDEPIR